MSDSAISTRRGLALGLLTFLLMLPETLPVPVLRAAVLERFAVTDAQASWFMSANMLGAIVAAPVIAWLGDRTRSRRGLCIAAIALDAILVQLLAHPFSFAEFLGLRVLEGMAHISALSLLMAQCSDAAGERRGRVMGMVGAGLTLGVALGAALGGKIGKTDPLLTLHTGSGVLAAATLLALACLPADTSTSLQPRAKLRDALQQSGAWLPLAFAFVDRFTVGFFTSGFPLCMAGVHGLSGPDIGILLACFLLPFALLSYPFGRLAERIPSVWLVAVGSGAYGVLVMLVGGIATNWLWYLMPALGLASAVMFVPTLLLLLERCPNMGRSAAMAAFHGAGSLGFLLGPLCCGAIVAWTGELSRGYTLAFAFAGLTELLCVFLLVPAIRRLRSAAQ